jgi:hypothetical protein
MGRARRAAFLRCKGGSGREMGRRIGLQRGASDLTEGDRRRAEKLESELVLQDTDSPTGGRRKGRDGREEGEGEGRRQSGESSTARGGGRTRALRAAYASAQQPP